MHKSISLLVENYWHGQEYVTVELEQTKQNKTELYRTSLANFRVTYENCVCVLHFHCHAPKKQYLSARYVFIIDLFDYLPINLFLKTSACSGSVCGVRFTKHHSSVLTDTSIYMFSNSNSCPQREL